MSERISLADFVKLCNEYDRDCYTEERKNEDVVELAGVFVGKISKDSNDYIFYKTLVARGYDENSYEYCFLQNNSLAIHISPMNPYATDEEGRLDRKTINQKWHFIIAVLAYLDTASDKKYGSEMDSKYRIGEIQYIEIDREKKRIRVAGIVKSTRWYTSRDMFAWVNSCLCENVSKSI